MSQPELWNRRCANLWETVLIFIYSRDSKIALRLAMESIMVIWSVVDSILEWMISFSILTCAPREHFIDSFCSSAFGFLQFLLQHLVFSIFQKSYFLSCETINTFIIPVFGKALILSELFPIVSFAFFFHTHLWHRALLFLVAVSSLHLSQLRTETLLLSHRCCGKKSFASSSFVNSTLISSHFFHSQKSRGKVFSWFSQHRAERT